MVYTSVCHLQRDCDLLRHQHLLMRHSVVKRCDFWCHNIEPISKQRNLYMAHHYK